MEFSITAEQRALKQTMVDFGRNEFRDTVIERDNASVFDLDLWKKMADVGLLGLPYPEEYGGSGASCLDTCIACEGFSRGAADAGMALAMGAHTILCGVPIWKLGTEEQKRKYLPKMADGSWIGCFGLTEPGSGSDAAAMRTTAVKRGDRYIVNGSKMFITNAPYAHQMVLTAVTEPEAKAAGISAFILDLDLPGVTIGKHLDKLGMRTSSTSEVVFEDVEIPESALLGPENFGFMLVAKLILGWERSCLLSPSIGLLERMIETCARYANERRQFNRPIGDFPAIRHKIAAMTRDLEIARQLLYRVAWILDTGDPDATPLAEAAICKLFISDALEKHASEAIQIHGGWGYIKEFHVERSLRDQKLSSIGAGTSEVQRSIIARSLLNLGY